MLTKYAEAQHPFDNGIETHCKIHSYSLLSIFKFDTKVKEIRGWDKSHTVSAYRIFYYFLIDNYLIIKRLTTGDSNKRMTSCQLIE